MIRVIEELLPFVTYLAKRGRLCREAYALDNAEEAFADFKELDIDTARCRLKEEHNRARILDEKTGKFALAVSVGLSILGGTAAAFSKLYAQGTLQVLITVFSGASVLYMLFGGLSSLGAFTTLPRFGYGTTFILESRTNKTRYINALAAQEKINLVRQTRNEAAFQCLRNGLLLLSTAIAISIIAAFAYAP